MQSSSLSQEDRKEIAQVLRKHARELASRNRRVFKEQIARLHRQANRLDPEGG